jgi:hypothetical protein
MDTIVSQVVAAVAAAIARMIEGAEDVAADLFTAGDDPAARRRDYVATVRALGVWQGEGNRVVVSFPADTPGGRSHGHGLATAALDQGSAGFDLPDTAEVTDHNGTSILAW